MEQHYVLCSPWDIPKDSDSKADPFISHHIVLEGRDDG